MEGRGAGFARPAHPTHLYAVVNIVQNVRCTRSMKTEARTIATMTDQAAYVELALCNHAFVGDTADDVLFDQVRFKRPVRVRPVLVVDVQGSAF